MLLGQQVRLDRKGQRELLVPLAQQARRVQPVPLDRKVRKVLPVLLASSTTRRLTAAPLGHSRSSVGFSP